MKHVDVLGKMLDKKCTFYTGSRKEVVGKELLERAALNTGKAVEGVTNFIGEEMSKNCKAFITGIGAPPSNMKSLSMARNVACQLSKASREKPEGFKKFLLGK